ncbi:MAG: hypothetical protein LBL81_02345 [Tannerella sp.]|nr:hypothetical protein [Tannerella sp.]
MKRYFGIIAGLLLGAFGITACLDEAEPLTKIAGGGSPSITGDSIGKRDATSIAVFALISRQNGAPVTDCGFLFVQSGHQDTSKIQLTENEGTAPIQLQATLSNLSVNTTYLIRAYAANSQGISYGSEMSAKTTSGLGEIRTLPADSVRGVSALLGGNITDKGDGAILQQGVILSAKADLSAPCDTLYPASAADSFYVKADGLSTLSTYYALAFAKNRFGFFYGDTISFQTTDGRPKITSLQLSNVLFTQASYSARLSSTGDAPLTRKGICWVAYPNTPTVNDTLSVNKTSDFSGTVSSLSPGMRYNFRAFAENSYGVGYSPVATLTTASKQPVVELSSIGSMADGAALVWGQVISSGQGNITSAGFCWGTSTSPTINDSYVSSPLSDIGTYSQAITKLKGGLTYYVRAFAQNDEGVIGYSAAQQITTPPVFTAVAPFTGGVLLPGTAACFVLNNAAYLVGGDRGASYSNALWAYSMSNNRWDAMQAFPGGAMKWQAAATLNNMGYVFGGRNISGAYSKQIYRYLPAQNQWSDVTPGGTAPDPMYAAAGCAFNGSAWFIGGCRDTIHGEVWSFDSYAWTRRPDLPEEQYGGIAVATDYKIYAGFGFTNLLGTASSRTLYSYTSGANGWIEESSLPAAAGSIRTATVYKNSIYMVDSNGVIWAYSISDKSWTRKSTLPVPNNGDYQHCLFVLGGSIYIGLGSSYQSLLKYSPEWDN